MHKKLITLFVPIHKLLKDDEVHLDNCVQSIQNQNLNNVQVLFNCTESIKKKIEGKYPNLEKTFYTKNGTASYISKINFAIQNLVKTDYFLTVEFDDVLTKGYIDNLIEHIDSYSNVDMFLPIVNEVDKDGKFISLKNESAWAYGYMKEQGKFDIDKLLLSPTFSIVSSCVKSEVLKDLLFKENIKVFFNYEWFLRFLNKGYSTYVIPKIGVKHMNMRKNSFLKNSK